MTRRSPSPPVVAARVLSVREECPRVRTFQLEVPVDFTFAPGMFVLVSFPEARGPDSRAYSIASSPLERGAIELTVGMAGAFTRRLFALRPGDPLVLRGPSGEWRYAHDMARAVLISGGTGITPYRSMARYVLDQGLPNRLHLFYSAKTPSAIIYREELARWAARGIKVFTTITRPEALAPGERWEGPVGRLQAETIRREVGDLSLTHFFVCGPRSLVVDLSLGLKSLGVDEDFLHAEAWN